MTLHTIQLHNPTSPAAAKAALNQTESGDQVLFVLPENVDAFANEVRLQLLRREADQRGVQVALVTEDADVCEFASRTRIPIFASEQKAQGRWRYPKPLGDLPPPTIARPVIVQPPHEVGRQGLIAPEIVSTGEKTLLAGYTRQGRDHWYLAWLGYLFVIVAVIVLVGILALILVPQATVTVVPARSRTVSSIELAAQIGIDDPDFLNAIIPARAVQARVEGLDYTQTTGADDAPLGSATGVVTLINQTNREIIVPQSTVMRTATGNNVRFRTMEEITVPTGVGQQISAPIEAVEAGREGNVPAFTISEIEGPLNVSLRVSNQAPTAGGTVETVAAVTQADKERVRGQLQESLQLQAYSKLAESMQQGEVIPPETVSTFTLAETYDRFAGEQAGQLGLQLQLLARGTAVDVAGADQLAERTLRQNIPSGHFLLEETIQIGQPTFIRFTEDTIDITLTASGDTLVPVRTGEVRSLLAGVPLEEAESLLLRELDLATTPEIFLEPNWLNRLPYIPTRITVRVIEG